MASSSNNPIGWCDRTWNPVRGCSRVSPGCDNCYAMGQAHRFSNTVNGKPGPFAGLTTKRKGKVDWSGSVRLVSDALALPLRTRNPTTFFVNSMSDLFHPSLKDEQIDRVFGAMWACLYIGRRNPIPGHVFQVLTKRAERMRDYMSTDRRSKWAQFAGAMCEDSDAVHDQVAFHKGSHPRIWLGVSCEDQERADERLPALLETPAAVRFVSAEPLLGPIDLRHYMHDSTCPLGDGGIKYGQGARDVCLCTEPREVGLDWVIVGGEAGPGSRHLDVEWIRAIVTQCRVAGTACYVKQVGSGASLHTGIGRGRHIVDSGRERFIVRHPKGGDINEFPEDIRVREFPQ